MTAPTPPEPTAAEQIVARLDSYTADQHSANIAAARQRVNDRRDERRERAKEAASHLRVVYTRPALHLVTDAGDLTCERCENTGPLVDWCDHTTLCPECRSDRGCRHCWLDTRSGA